MGIKPIKDIYVNINILYNSHKVVRSLPDSSPEYVIPNGLNELPHSQVISSLKKLGFPRTTIHPDFGGRIFLLGYHPSMVGDGFSQHPIVHGENTTFTNTKWACSKDIISCSAMEMLDDEHHNLLIDIYPSLEHPTPENLRQFNLHISYHTFSTTSDAIYILLSNHMATADLLEALKLQNLEPHKYKSGYFLTCWTSIKTDPR